MNLLLKIKLNFLRFKLRICVENKMWFDMFTTSAEITMLEGRIFKRNKK